MWGRDLDEDEIMKHTEYQNDTTGRPFKSSYFPGPLKLLRLCSNLLPALELSLTLEKSGVEINSSRNLCTYSLLSVSPSQLLHLAVLILDCIGRHHVC